MDTVHDIVSWLFVLLWVAAAASLVKAMFFWVRMTFQLRERIAAWSSATLWNPMNVIFRPGLLNEAGRRSRRLAIRWGLIFFCSVALAAGVALLSRH